MVLPAAQSPSQCLLEWHPYTKDRTMGLNHQQASLSCALSEAFYLERSLLIPDRICLFGLHTERWPGKFGAGETCIPIGELFDIDLLRSLVGLQLRETHHTNRTAGAPGARDSRRDAVVVDGSWKSARVKKTYPCDGKTPVIRRRVDSFWFAQCTRGTTDTHSVLTHIHNALGSPPTSPKPVNVLLRSGLFYAPPIKAAAAAIRARIGADYASVHVRRSDKLTACAPEECKSRDMLTRPDAIGTALRLWFPPGFHVYIGSTEKPAFFDALRPHYTLHFAEDYGAELRAISNNYALYAVETLVFFGSVGTVETLGYTASWFKDACFPASQLRSQEQANSAHGRAKGNGRASLALTARKMRGAIGRRLGADAVADARQSGRNSSVRVQCRDASGIVVNGVFYGGACIDNPPCGHKMALVPAPEGCGAAPQAAAPQRSASSCARVTISELGNQASG